MSIYLQDESVTVWHGDCLDVLRGMADESVDAVVTDPPYALTELPVAKVVEALTRWLNGDRAYVPAGAGFMGRSWDEFVPPPAAWDEALRVLKPGGHLLCFSAPRTVDLMGISIRMAGFHIRDSITWIGAQGFPKSRDVSKDIDKTSGAERDVLGVESALGPERPISNAWTKAVNPPHGSPLVGGNPDGRLREITAPATDDARRWSGWGTALKPASEPIIVARKPLRGPVAANVVTYGTGALNIDACRVEYEQGGSLASNPSLRTHINGGNGGHVIAHEENRRVVIPNPAGRWPSNVVLTHSPDCPPDGKCAPGCPVAELDAQSGYQRTGTTGPGASGFRTAYVGGSAKPGASFAQDPYETGGGASRYFPTFRFEAKAPTSERPTAVLDGEEVMPETGGRVIAHPT